MDCHSCAGEILGAISKLEGVYKVQFHKLSAEVRFRYDPGLVDSKMITSAVEDKGFTVFAEAGKGSYKAYPEYPPESDVVVIEREGAEVDIAALLVKGKYTIVDFFADWCGPCRKLGESLVGIIRDNPNIALRKIDIVDWDRPVVQQHMDGVARLPYVVIYDPDGVVVEKISGLDVLRVKRALGLAVE